MKVDISGLEEYRKQLEQLQKNGVDELCKSISKELAARLLRQVVRRTPVGVYKDKHKKGGTLRRGWTAGKNKSVKQYVDSLNITHYGNTYTIELSNNIEYASYVEYGHRTANHAGWVDGKFMLTISEQEISTITPALVEKRLYDKIKGVLG